MTLGQLVHVPDFNYFESMSALELMDPKMDSGMLAPDEVILTVAERLEKGLVPLTFTSAADLLATLDRMEQCEAAWRNGQPMAQSLLTCLYFHPCVSSALVNAGPLAASSVSVSDTLGCILNAYLSLALKSVTVQRYAIHRADIYEEEDFSPLNSDLALGDGISDDLVVYWLDLAEKRLELLVKGSKSKKKTAVEALHGDPGIATDFAALFLCRLTFRRHFYAGLSALGSAESPDLEAAAASFDAAHVVLQRMATERLEAADICFQGHAMGFDMHMSRLLASTMPPREAKLDSAADAFAQTTQLCRHLGLACTPPLDIKGMDDLKAYLTHLSSLRPNILVRSYAA
ncbi:hypothetical protein DYB38_004893, partial [Aphanomyces astaci]